MIDIFVTTPCQVCGSTQGRREFFTAPDDTPEHPAPVHGVHPRCLPAYQEQLRAAGVQPQAHFLLRLSPRQLARRFPVPPGEGEAEGGEGEGR